MIEVAGSLYPGASSQRRDASLQITESGQVLLQYRDESGKPGHKSFAFSELDISARIGNTPRYIDFKNGDRFETGDNESIDRIQRTLNQGKAHRFIHLLENHLHLALLTALFVIVFVWALVKYGFPVMANAVAHALPLEASQYLGQGTLEILDEAFFEPSKLPIARQRELNKLFEPYIQQYAEHRIKVDFRYSEPAGANAMALPDGQIIFTDNMVNLAQDDRELIAILGHEIGHVVHRHLLRRVIQSSGITLVIVMISGDVSAASSLIVAIPNILLELSYSRDFEVEADDFAHAFLQQQNIEPHYFADIMLRLMRTDEDIKKDGAKAKRDTEPEQEGFLGEVSPYLSTHPVTQERVKRFQ